MCSLCQFDTCSDCYDLFKAESPDSLSISKESKVELIRKEDSSYLRRIATLASNTPSNLSLLIF
jgi:hypothetical protein